MATPIASGNEGEEWKKLLSPGEESPGEPSHSNAEPTHGDVKVVVGAKGPLGTAVARKLSERGEKVAAVSLKGPWSVSPFTDSVELRVADPQNPHDIALACRGAKIVYDCYEPSYSEMKKEWAIVTSNVLLAAIEVGTPVLVTSPLVTTTQDNTRVENDILRAHGGGLTGSAVMRIPQLCGAGVINPMWKLVYESAIEGKKAHWVGDLDVKRSLLDVEDAASALIAIGDNQQAQGKIWTVANPSPVSGREFIEMAFSAAGNPPKVGKWGRGIVLTGSLLAGEARSIIEMPYDYYSSFVLDGSEFSQAFPDFSYTAPDRSTAKAIVWYRQQMATVH